MEKYVVLILRGAGFEKASTGSFHVSKLAQCTWSQPPQLCLRCKFLPAVVLYCCCQQTCTCSPPASSTLSSLQVFASCDTANVMYSCCSAFALAAILMFLQIGVLTPVKGELRQATLSQQCQTLNLVQGPGRLRGMSLSSHRTHSHRSNPQSQSRSSHHQGSTLATRSFLHPQIQTSMA